MNWRATVAAGLIFVALLVVVVLESRQRVAEEGEVFRQSFMGLDLYGIDPAQVTRVQIQRKGEDEIILEKRGESWNVVQPFEGLADDEEVTRIVEAVALLRPVASREGVDLTDPEFGLAEADLTAVLTYEGGSATLKVGAETPAGTQRFAEIAGDARLFVVGADLRTTLWTDPQSLREKNVAAVTPEEVKQLTLDHADERVVAVSRPGAEPDAEALWRLAAPIQTDADEWNVKQVISSIGDMTAEGFLSAEEAAKADTGFDNAQATVTIERTEGEPFTLTFGNTATREVGEPATQKEIIFVRSSQRPEVMMVRAGALDEVQKTLFDLRDKSVLSLKRDDVTRVKVERTEGLTFQIARRPSGWFVEKPKNFEARQGAVDDILWDLEDLSAVEFVADEPTPQQLREFGLTVPQTAITIERRGADPVKVLIGGATPENDYYAMTSESKRVVKISEFLMGDLPEDVKELEKGSVEAPENPFANEPPAGEGPDAPPAPGG